MRGLFYYMSIKNDKGYFVEQESNTLVEFSLLNNEVLRTLCLKKNYDRSTGVGNIDIIDNRLILYPAWSDTIITLDIEDWGKMKKIKLTDSISDGLWCDYRPLFLQNVKKNKIYLYKGRNECNVFELDIDSGNINNVKMKKEGDFGLFRGCGKAYTCRNNCVVITSYEDSDALAEVSLSENSIKIYKTGCGCLTNAIIVNGLFWLTNREGEICIWSPSKGVINRIKPLDVDEQYSQKRTTLIENPEYGVIVGGLYRDGSYLMMQDEYTQKRLKIERLSYLRDESESCINNVHCQIAWSYDRSFIQLKNGVYAYGNDLNKIFEPVDISYKDLKLDMVQECRDYKLSSYISEAL